VRKKIKNCVIIIVSYHHHHCVIIIIIMTSAPLFATSCAMLVAHCLLVAFRWQRLLLLLLVPKTTALVALYILGPVTSMWNHGTRCALARWTDRVVMTVGLGVDVWLWWLLPHKTEAFAVGALTALAVVSYMCAKWWNNQHTTLAHALAHALVTSAHVLLVLFLTSRGLPGVNAVKHTHTQVLLSSSSSPPPSPSPFPTHHPS
jgi:hypothetical protein